MNKSVVFIFSLICTMAACKTIRWEQKIAENRVSKYVAQLKPEVGQLLLVYNDTLYSKAHLVAMEKSEGKWKSVFGPVPAGIGKNGFAVAGKKREGDGMSPTGIFEMGQLFTYEETVKTKMPYQQSTAEDKWIDDPESADYNKYVRGKTDAESYENLLLKSDYYKYCMVIEYNTNPVVKGKGSAIFFHLNFEEHESTAGCVAVSEKDMREILQWLNPDKNPMIIMGE